MRFIDEDELAVVMFIADIAGMLVLGRLILLILSYLMGGN